MSDEFPMVHGDVGHSCYDEDGTVTCIVAKMLISGLGPGWRELLQTPGDYAEKTT